MLKKFLKWLNTGEVFFVTSDVKQNKILDEFENKLKLGLEVEKHLPKNCTADFELLKKYKILEDKYYLLEKEYNELFQSYKILEAKKSNKSKSTKAEELSNEICGDD